MIRSTFNADGIKYYDNNGNTLFTLSNGSMNVEDMDWDYCEDYYQNVVNGTRVSGKTLWEKLNSKEKELIGENEEEKKI